ncbi:hypothetical protein AB6C43_12955 [Vibrio splendidus]
MSNVIDFKQYQLLSGCKGLSDIPENERLELEAIQEEITERYIRAMSEINISFNVQVTEEQGELIRAKILEVQKSYEKIIFDAVSDVTNKAVQLHILKKHN